MVCQAASSFLGISHQNRNALKSTAQPITTVGLIPCFQFVLDITWWPNYNRLSSCFPGGASVKEPACQCRRHETLVLSLGPEHPPMVTHSSSLAWRISWTEMLGRLQLMGSQRVKHDWSDLVHIPLPNQSALNTEISSSVTNSEIEGIKFFYVASSNQQKRLYPGTSKSNNENI